MGAHEKALGVLRAAEEKIRAILVQAAADGDYDHLPQIAEWAKLLATTLGGRIAVESALATPSASPREQRQSQSYNGIHEQADTDFVRVHGPRVTMVHQRKSPAASESIQLPDGQRQHRRMRRFRRTEAS